MMQDSSIGENPVLGCQDKPFFLVTRRQYPSQETEYRTLIPRKTGQGPK